MREATFLNRSDELDLLHRLWTSAQSELVVLHGRRRVGKTELLATFAEDKPGVYLEALDMRAPDRIYMRIPGRAARALEAKGGE